MFFVFFARAEYNALPRAGVILVSGRALIFIRVRHLLAREGVCGNLNSSPGLKLASTLNDRSYNNFRVSIADMHSRLLLALRSISWSKKRVLMAQRFIAFLYWHLLASINSHSHPGDFLAPLAVAPTPFLHVPETAVWGVRVS